MQAQVPLKIWRGDNGQLIRSAPERFIDYGRMTRDEIYSFAADEATPDHRQCPAL